jgi:hypothetical protein
MFGLFGKKEKGIQPTDIIWLSQELKWQGLSAIFEKEKNTVFVFWFEETIHSAEEFLAGKTSGDMQLILASHYKHHDENRSIIFAEHYPLAKKEQDFFQNLHLQKPQIHSALDEPLFLKFGAAQIISMIRKMGMNETESLENSMISGAIRNAQERISDEVTLEQGAQSQQEWLVKNLG